MTAAKTHTQMPEEAFAVGGGTVAAAVREATEWEVAFLDLLIVWKKVYYRIDPKQ